MVTQFINIEERFDPRRVVTNPNPLTKDKKFSPDGIFSEEFFGKKNTAEMTTYQCECGKYRGKFLRGYICEECGKPVEKSESVLEKLVWIDLKNYFVINPVFYFEIAKLYGGSAKLNKILNYDKKIDRDGNVLDEEKSEYDNIGIVEFRERFFEILEWMYINAKDKDKAESIVRLLFKHYDKIFISKIPVFDTSLRPATITYKDKPIFKFDEINNNYNFIIKLSNMINKENKDFELIVLPNLYTIQCKMNIIFNKVVENLAGKQGFIRSNTLGNRVNFSARCVITPISPGYDITDIIVPYLVFVELYSFQLCNMLSKLKRINLAEAQKIVLDSQSKFNDEVYNLCLELVNKTKYGLGVLGIRNPTIARGSILYLKIANVKKDYTDLTISVHNSILRLWAGDYDGK